MSANPPPKSPNRLRRWTGACAHTLLFAAYPVLAMLAYNIGEMPASDALRALLVSLAAAFLLLLVMRLILRDWVKASLVSTGALVLFFSYGHIYELVREYNLADALLGKHKVLLPVWLILFGLWSWWVVSAAEEEAGSGALPEYPRGSSCAAAPVYHCEL